MAGKKKVHWVSFIFRFGGVNEKAIIYEEATLHSSFFLLCFDTFVSELSKTLFSFRFFVYIVSMQSSADILLQSPFVEPWPSSNNNTKLKKVMSAVAEEKVVEQLKQNKVTSLTSTVLRSRITFLFLLFWGFTFVVYFPK